MVVFASFCCDLRLQAAGKRSSTWCRLVAMRETDVQGRLTCGSTKKLCQVRKGGRRESEHGLAIGLTASVSTDG